MKTKFILGIASIMITLPFISLANGGDQRVVENKYFINLSRSPFTPRVGVKTSMLASFVDITKNKLIADDLIVKIRVAKLGGIGTDKKDFLFKQDTIPVKGGVLEFPYTFKEAGLHEIFFDFAFASHPQKVYEVPDFLIDVQKQEVEPQQNQSIFLIVMAAFVSLIIGFAAGRFKNNQ